MLPCTAGVSAFTSSPARGSPPGSGVFVTTGVGVGLGTATLGEPRNGLDIAAEMGVSWANDSDRDDQANWGWPMLDIEPWPEPIPMRGAQGFWNWSTPAAVNL